MDKGELFKWLVAYHSSTNVDQHFSRARERGGDFSSGRSHLCEGLDENEAYKGLLIVANGATLIDRLQRDRVVLDSRLEAVEQVHHQSDFFEYLAKQSNGDGAYVFDSVNRRIVKVRELKNDVGSPNLRIEHYLPPDFLASDGSVGMDEIGTKTRLAVRLPQAYPDTHALQIKRTAYSSLGLGKVTHFDHWGLAEEFFLIQDHSSKSPFIRPEYGLVGVYRQYDHIQDKLVRILEQRIGNVEEIAGYQSERKAA